MSSLLVDESHNNNSRVHLNQVELMDHRQSQGRFRSPSRALAEDDGSMLASILSSQSMMVREQERAADPFFSGSRVIGGTLHESAEQPDKEEKAAQDILDEEGHRESAKQQRLLAQRMEMEKQSMLKKEQRMMAFKGFLFSHFVSETILLIVFVMVVFNNWDEYNRLKDVNEELWYVLNANMWTIVAKIIVEMIIGRQLSRASLARCMAFFYAFEVLSQCFVMYFASVAYRSGGIDDLYRQGFNTMNQLVLGMLWPRLIAFIFFMVSCPLALEISTERREDCAQRASQANPTGGLSLEDPTEMLSPGGSKHHFKQPQSSQQADADGPRAHTSILSISKFSDGAPFELVYFDIHGRACQLRMLLWYCGIEFRDSRITFEQFGQSKAEGAYKFGSLPVINYPDGTQLAQTQSMMRHFALQHHGKNNEVLYPGRSNPDDCYRIDQLTELSDSWLAPGAVYVSANPDREKVQAFIAEFPKLIEKIDAALRANHNPKFLVGDSLTIADISLGAFMLRFVLNPEHNDRAQYAAVVQRYPTVHAWATETIEPIFKDWFAAQPKGFVKSQA